MSESHAGPLLQNSQWATQLEDAVQFGQTRGLFLLSGGPPLLLEENGSGAGSAGGDNSSVGGILAEGCGACGSIAAVGSNARGVGTGLLTVAGMG